MAPGRICTVVWAGTHLHASCLASGVADGRRTSAERAKKAKRARREKAEERKALAKSAKREAHRAQAARASAEAGGTERRFGRSKGPKGKLGRPAQVKPEAEPEAVLSEDSSGDSDEDTGAPLDAETAKWMKAKPASRKQPKPLQHSSSSSDSSDSEDGTEEAGAPAAAEELTKTRAGMYIGDSCAATDLIEYQLEHGLPDEGEEADAAGHESCPWTHELTVTPVATAAMMKQLTPSAPPVIPELGCEIVHRS
jgi:hypothetical protein